MVTQHPAGIFYVCLPKAIHPCHTVQYESVNVFLYVHSVRGGGGVVTYIYTYSNRNFLGLWTGFSVLFRLFLI